MRPSYVHNEIFEVLSAVPKPHDELRQQAYHEFLQLGLPGPKNEEYKHTPITRFLEKYLNASLPFQSESFLPDENLWKLQFENAYQVVVFNGQVLKEKSFLPPEINCLPMSKAAGELQLVKEHIGKYAGFKADSFASWNTAAWSDGVFLEIPDGFIVDKPIIIYYIHNASAGQVKSVTRNLILAGKDSRLTLAEKWFTYGTNATVSNSVSEILLRNKASVNHLVIQQDPGTHIQYLYNQFWQEAGSQLNSHVVTLSGTFVRNNTHVALHGACESHLYGLYLVHENTFVDNHTVVDHREPNAISNELYKGVLDGKSNGVFNGKIFVRPGAQKTNAFQSNRNLLLSDQAVVHTKPQLEIWADDVKCSHGCTVGQLDDDALFYLRSRGLDKKTAKAMLLYAFASEVIETIQNPDLKQHLNELINERLHHNAYTA